MLENSLFKFIFYLSTGGMVGEIERSRSGEESEEFGQD